MGKSLVAGVGLNDANYEVCVMVSGKKHTCPFYYTWGAMLKRGYSEKWKQKNKTYLDVKVCAEWHTFSSFKAWMETQDWEGKQLDKDLLVQGNKVYSPETCVFIPAKVNSFLNRQKASRGDLPVVVTLHRKTGKFLAQCRNYNKPTQDYLGLYETPEKAHLAWLDRKLELALELSLMQNDPRIAKALLETKYEEW